MRPTSASGAACVAVAALVLAPGASAAGSADRTPPTRPTIAGPHETKSRTPVFRLAARDNRTTTARLQFLCSFDSERVHPCSRRPTKRLAPGLHGLRAFAVDRAGNRSRGAQLLFSVLAPDAEGRVVALDEATGAQRWATQVPMAGGAVRAANGRVLVEGGYSCSLDYGRIISLDGATGAIGWRTEAAAGPCGIGGWPAAADGVVFTRDGTALTGLDAATGKPVWRQAGADPGVGGFTADAGDLALDVDGDRLVARDRRDGTVRWTATPERTRIDSVIGPTADDVNAYLVIWSLTGGLAVEARALADGHLVWRRAFADIAPAVDGFSIPEGDASGVSMAISTGDNGFAVLVLDRATGRLLWKSATDDYQSPPLVSGGTMFTSQSGPDRLVGLDAATGVPRWQLPDPARSDPLAVDGGVVIAGGAGRLEAVDGATGAVRWVAPLGKNAFWSAAADGGVVYAFQLGRLAG